MLNTISWKEYLSVLTFLVVCYYIVIAWLYYKKEILNLFGITMIEPGVIPASSLQQFSSSLKKENETDYLPKSNNEPALQSLSDELTAFFEAQNNNPAKEDITFGLLSVLNKYPSLHYPSLRTRINQLLLSAANHNGISNLEEDELEAIWKQVH